MRNVHAISCKNLSGIHQILQHIPSKLFLQINYVQLKQREPGADTRLADKISKHTGMRMGSLERTRISQGLGSFEMGQMTRIKFFLIFGSILVDGSTSGEAIEDVLVSSESWVQEEVRLLCEELEGEKYDQNRTLWKTLMLPAETLLTKKIYFRPDRILK